MPDKFRQAVQRTAQILREILWRSHLSLLLRGEVKEASRFGFRSTISNSQPSAFSRRDASEVCQTPRGKRARAMERREAPECLRGTL